MSLVAIAVWACGSNPAPIPVPSRGPQSSVLGATNSPDGSFVGGFASGSPEDSEGASAGPSGAGASQPGSQPGSTNTPGRPGGNPGSTPDSSFGTPFPTPTPTQLPTPLPGASSSFTVGGGTVTIAAAGDIACDPASNSGAPAHCDQAATAALIGSLHPTAVLTLGDTQYETGTLSAFQAVFAPTWGKYKTITFPAIGNHEYLTARAAGYFSYFGLPAYYSYNLGAWHLISLDSECSFVGGCGAGSAEERWLRTNLASFPTQCTLVYWHEPRWSSGEWQDATQMTAIWDDLVAAHADVVLSGHNHDYERFVPLDATGNPDPNGVQEFVVGTGGKNHTGWTEGPISGEVVRDDSSFGVIYMTLGPTSYSWRYVPAPGYSFTDSGSAACR
jgi:acid phosphatase type 7